MNVGRVFFTQYRKGRTGIEAFRGSILEHARKLGVEIASECGGLGTCGRCVVRIEKGMDGLSQKTEPERGQNLEADERLACQARIVNPNLDVTVVIKEFGKYSILSDSPETETALEPAVRRDGHAVRDASGGKLDRYGGEIFGLAVDVGTTTLVGQVLDLEDGRVVARFARNNPQIAYGNDVISRIGHTMSRDNGLKELQAAVVRGINEELSKLEREEGCQRRYIYEVMAVGNSTMRDIFFGQPVVTLGVIPFESSNPSALTTKAAQIGLSVNPGAVVYSPPLIGGHAGADALADIMACGMYRQEHVTMLIDIGTNGEVAVGNRDRIMTASCAAGGAYEGATTECGVGAIEGAIKNIWISDGSVGYETIGGKPPIGICGSGLIDLLAELLHHGIMSRKAKIKEPFHVTDSIRLTQQDIYQLITAKAGLRLDQDLLIQYYGTTLEDIEHIYLAGGFGNFINPDNAIAIGLLPPAPEKVVRIGNGALAGAREMLLSVPMRHVAETLARKIEHTKPNEREPSFPYLVAERMYFQQGRPQNAG